MKARDRHLVRSLDRSMLDRIWVRKGVFGCLESAWSRFWTTKIVSKIASVLGSSRRSSEAGD